MNRVVYRVNFIILLIAVFLQMFFNLLFVKIIFGFLNNIAGWTYYEALLIVATYMIVDGVLWVTTSHLSALVNHIRMGTLDGILVKPVDGQFMVSFWRGDIEDIVRIFSGIIVLFYAVSNLDIYISYNLIFNIFAYLLLLINAIIIGYSINMLFKVLSFWTIEGSAFFHLSDTLFRITQYPTDIFYHSIIRILASSIIPLAFMATIPVKLLIQDFNILLFIGSFLITYIFFYSSRKAWLFSLKHYSSASS